MPKTIEELRRDAQQGNLNRNDITIYLTRGWITDSAAEELDSLILERSPAPAPTQQPTKQRGCLRLDWIAVIVSALAGGMVGLLGVFALGAIAGEDASACFLPILPPVGVVAGILFARRARNVFGWRIGTGATLIALLCSCGACASVDVISAWQTTRKLEQWGYNPEPLPFAPLLKDEYKGLMRTAMAGGRIAALLVVVTFVVVAIIVLRRQRQHP